MFLLSLESRVTIFYDDVLGFAGNTLAMSLSAALGQERQESSGIELQATSILNELGLTQGTPYMQSG